MKLKRYTRAEMEEMLGVHEPYGEKEAKQLFRRNRYLTVYQSVSDCDVLCDDCYKKLMGIIQ